MGALSGTDESNAILQILPLGENPLAREIFELRCATNSLQRTLKKQSIEIKSLKSQLGELISDTADLRSQYRSALSNLHHNVQQLIEAQRTLTSVTQEHSQEVVALITVSQIVSETKNLMLRFADPEGDFDAFNQQFVQSERFRKLLVDNGLRFDDSHRRALNRLLSKHLPAAHPMVPPSREAAQKLLEVMEPVSDRPLLHDVINAFYTLTFSFQK
jgi:hypothetical protein